MNRTRLVARLRPIQRRGQTSYGHRWMRPETDATPEVADRQPLLFDDVPHEKLNIPDRYEPTARESYALLGTRAPAFKAWFGDWESEQASVSQVRDDAGHPQLQLPFQSQPPASQAVDPEGKPMVLYHGSGSQFRAFDIQHISEGCRFGPGFYFSEDVGVADGATPNAPSDAGFRVRRIVLSGHDKEGLCDTIQDALLHGWMGGGFPAVKDAEHLEVAQQHLELWRMMPYITIGDVVNAFEALPLHFPVMALAGGMGLTHRGATYAVYLNIRQPLDLDDEMARTRFALKANLPIQHYTPQSLVRAFPSEDGFRNAVKAQGFDGLVGSALHGEGEDARTHRVWVAFEPSQIKAEQNRGSFDAGVSDIFKAVPNFKGRIHYTTNDGKRKRVLGPPAPKDEHETEAIVTGQSIHFPHWDVRDPLLRSRILDWDLTCERFTQPLPHGGRITSPDHHRTRYLFDKKLRYKLIRTPLGIRLTFINRSWHIFFSKGEFRSDRAEYFHYIRPTLENPVEIWRDNATNQGKHGSDRILFLANYPSKSEGKTTTIVVIAELDKVQDVKTAKGFVVTVIPKNRLEDLRSSGTLLYAKWRDEPAHAIKKAVPETKKEGVLAMSGMGDCFVSTPLSASPLRHHDAPSLTELIRPVINKRMPSVSVPNLQQICAAKTLATTPLPDSPKIYDYASTQVNVPTLEANAIRAWASANIPRDIWSKDGIETLPHVTVKYGLECGTREGLTPQQIEAEQLIVSTRLRVEIAPFLQKRSGEAITATCGTLHLFRNEEFDVLHISVNSPDLVELNARIKAITRCVDTHPNYQPHITLAYLQKGEGDHWEFDKTFEGLRLIFDALWFSGRNGWMTAIPLN